LVHLKKHGSRMPAKRATVAPGCTQINNNNK
jgi:hypothetical protein